MVDPGNLVQADQTALTTIVSLDPMYVYFDVDERTLLMIRRPHRRSEDEVADRGRDSRSSSGSPTRRISPIAGIIDFSDNKVDSGTGTLRLRGRTQQSQTPTLLPRPVREDQACRSAQTRKSILIDEQAIGSEQSNKFVYVVRKVKEVDKETKKEKEVERAFSKPIKVGALNKGLRAVSEGLAESDRVIISGLQRVKPGEPVTPIPVRKTAAREGAPPTPSPSPTEPAKAAPTAMAPPSAPPATGEAR